MDFVTPKRATWTILACGCSQDHGESSNNNLVVDDSHKVRAANEENESAVPVLLPEGQG